MRTFCVILSLSICAVVLSFFISTFYAYNYPMKYSKEIVMYSSEFNVDSAIVASVANAESNFREDAVSNKGAVGIMQLLPSTAEWVANRMGEKFDEDLLKNGEYNLKLGSYYLAYLFDFFDDRNLAICAYNAGQGNVSNWLKDKRYSSDGKKLDTIPFKETDKYLNKVLKNYNYYKNRYK